MQASHSHDGSLFLPDLLGVLRASVADRYAVQSELGRGGMATVFLAEDLKHGRSVAIKVLDPEVGRAIGSERFLREIEIAARLQHPHILPLYDSGAADGLLFYVMPFVEGETLRGKLTREKQLSLEDAVTCTTQVASALAYAHAHGVVHRDIKPENIMLSQGTAVVADFGIARAVGGSAAGGPALTEAGSIIGTPMYMSPEQSTGGEIDARSDQYSLACVLYELLVGQPPFTGPTMQVLARHSMDTVSPPSIVRPSIPPEVEGALLRALAKVPADRFPTMARFSEALNGLSASPSGQFSQVRRPTFETPLPRGAPEGSVTLTLRRRSLYVGGLVTGAVVLLAGLGVWLRGRGTASPVTAGLDPTTIAVRYFQDLSADHHLGYVADGFTEALIGRLSEVPGLNLISRAGTEAWRNSPATPDSMARALQAGTLVDGRVEPVGGDRIRVQVWLIDGNSGADLGQRASFERPASDLIGARDSLATQAADLIRQQLGREVRLRAQQEGTHNTLAWSLLQRAEQDLKAGEAAADAGDTVAHRAAFQAADSLLGAAEGLDPQWADPLVARGRLAYLRSRRSLRDPIAAGKWIAVGMGHVDRGLSLAPNNPDALELRGNLQYWKYLLRLEQDPAKAAALRTRARNDLEQATRLRPTQAGAWSSLSHLYANDTSFSTTDVLLAAQRAYEADAFLAGAPRILERLFNASYDLGQTVDAVHWCGEGTRRFPDEGAFTICRIMLMTMPGQDPDPGTAWRLAESETLTRGQTSGPPAFQKARARMIVAAVLARAGLKDSARAVAQAALAGPDVDPTRYLYWRQAMVLTELGDTAAAVAALKTYLAASPERRRDFVPDPGWYFRSLLNDRAFRDLVGMK